jgi:hypothetical protein
MRRCPECWQTYTDETLNLCLDDGACLLEAPATADETATAIVPSEAEAEPFRTSSDTAAKQKEQAVGNFQFCGRSTFS